MYNNQKGSLIAPSYQAPANCISGTPAVTAACPSSPATTHCKVNNPIEKECKKLKVN
jgi:hypothetical protein